MGEVKLVDVKLVEGDLPESKRSQPRQSFYQGDFPCVVMRIHQLTYRADVYDLSSDGLGVLPQEQIKGLDTIGQEADIRIGNSEWQRVKLASIHHVKFSGSFRLKLGFIFEKYSVQDSEYVECLGGYPQGFAKHPISYNKTILFNIIGFSAHGFYGLVRDRDMNAFFGMQLECHILFPTRGEQIGTAEIRNFSVVEGEGVYIECGWKNVTYEAKNAISEYLLMTDTSLSISALRALGFLVTDLESALVFRIASTESEFLKILDLRLRAAQADGRWIGETDTSVMKDSSDQFARQIYCELNGRIVAASRIVFNNGILERSEHSKYNVPIPEWIWKTGFVEGSRVCTDPDMRGSDIFMLMIQNMSDIVTKSGYRYMVMNCVKSLVPVYKKNIGVKNLGLKFNTEFMQTEPLYLLLVDVRNIQVGLNFMPFTWVVTAEVGDHLLKRGLIRLNFFEKFGRFFFAIAHRFLRWGYSRSKISRAVKKIGVR